MSPPEPEKITPPQRHTNTKTKEETLFEPSRNRRNPAPQIQDIPQRRNAEPQVQDVPQQR